MSSSPPPGSNVSEAPGPSERTGVSRLARRGEDVLLVLALAAMLLLPVLEILLRHLFKTGISSKAVARSLSVVVLALLLVSVALTVVLWAETGDRPFAQVNQRAIEYLFEVVSAFGTVGLSTGITSGLGDLAKLTLSLVMLAGFGVLGAKAKLDFRWYVAAIHAIHLLWYDGPDAIRCRRPAGEGAEDRWLIEEV
jgi:hypothetical protein